MTGIKYTTVNAQTFLVNALGEKGSPCTVFLGKKDRPFIRFIDERISATVNPTSLDICPGGAFDATGTVASQASSDPSSLPLRNLGFNTKNIVPNHAFIPTVSSLAIKDFTDYGENLGSQNLVCNKRSPFDAYYGPDDNQAHVTVTTENVAFLLQEMAGDTTGQSGIGVYKSIIAGDGGYKISGPTSVCLTFNGTYSVSAPSNAVVNWTTSEDLKVLSGNGTRSVTVGSTPIITGTSFIQASVVESCGTYKIVQPLIQPGFTAINADMTPCNGTYQGWNLNAIPNVANATNWQWTVDNPATLQCYFSSPNSAQTNADVSGGGGISVRYTDACGGVHKSGVTVYSNCITTASAVIFPNPSNSLINVAFNKLGEQPANSSIRTKSLAAIVIPESVELFSNSSTIPIWTVNQTNILSHNNKAVFDVKGLTPGFYYIHILFKDRKEFHTVQVF